MSMKLLSRITEAMLMLLAAFVVFCLVLFYIPGSRWGALLSGYWEGSVSSLKLFLTLAAAFALWILAELFFVFRTVEKDPFLERNVRAFLRMGAAAELAGLLFVGRCFLSFTPMTAVCAIVMLLAGMFALVLAGVFRRAVEYKAENDLTI